MKIVSRKPAETAPQRISKLSKLPVFFDLEGQRCIIAGGTAAAAWKAELLAAAGGFVEVYAEVLSDEFQALLDDNHGVRRIVVHREKWSAASFTNARFAIADLECRDEADRFCKAAKDAGVLANVIDQPSRCDFQFGSIVNRSPVVIGISTSGAAPILGQAIRQRIEALLPLSLSTWAALAGTIRNQVIQQLARGMPRRNFWERFSTTAFSQPAAAATKTFAGTMIHDAQQNTAPQAGSVTLVGAGPGDPSHLTIKAIRAMQSADVILYDDLVSPEVLELARREAKRITVGKRGGKSSCDQSDINAMMLKLAKQGKKVVRLKSGDPMIFGRAGEEIAMLESHGVSVTVVPGITSALALAAETRVSLTQRDQARVVSFVTGHASNGKLPETNDWAELARPDSTKIFYMGSKQASAIVDRLLSHGADELLPVVAMVSVSQPGQALWSGTLRDLPAGIRSLNKPGPVLIGIGKVFAKVRQEVATMEPKAGRQSFSEHNLETPLSA